MQFLYYPQYFSRSRPFFREALRGVAMLGSKTAFDRYRTEFKTFTECITAHLGKRFNGNSTALAVARAVELPAAIACAEFYLCGSRVIDVEPKLSAAFSLSNIEDVSFNDLKLPFETFFIHIGPGLGIVFNDCMELTGAYVRAVNGLHESGVRVTLCGTSSGATQSVAPEDETYELIFKGDVLSLPIGRAINAAIAVDKKDLQCSRGRAPDIAVTALEERHDRNRIALASACNIIGNTLCYVTAYPDDAVDAWQPGAPARLLQQSESHRPTEARRAHSKLADLGFVPVRRIGSVFAAHEHDEDRIGPAPHWRRGHWRHQACGHRMQLRKLIWLKPTRVLGAGIKMEPRVYKAGP